MPIHIYVTTPEGQICYGTHTHTHMYIPVYIYACISKPQQILCVYVCIVKNGQPFMKIQ